MNVKDIGLDAVEIKRFNSFAKNRSSRFLTNTFSPQELDYCFSYRDPAPHLAGTFAAKEAVWKSLGQAGILFSIIEIRRNKSGKPEAWIKGKEKKSVSVSISHTDTTAFAISIKK